MSPSRPASRPASARTRTPPIKAGDLERLQQDPRLPGYLVSEDDHATRKEWDPMEKLSEARGELDSAKFELQGQRRKLMKTKVETSKRILHSSRLGDAAAYKAMVYKEKLDFENVEPASEEQVQAVSELLNLKLAWLERTLTLSLEREI